ncbi:hypothetical protein [Niastella sp. OAS944]|uniref:hypothetical protein n=1 Tax=Niastella sp. OAS944 TaxID=2664089 RepID=UPI00349347DE|nr:hypothetical protein [Chitinophagaceae bacterium OAS944]
MKILRHTNFSFLLLLCVVTLFSCTTAQLYTYDIRLERPTPSQNLQFENDTISISFAFNYDYIDFELYNKLDEAIKVNWKDLSVSIDGETQRVIPSNAYFVGFPGKEPSIMVAPRSKIKDIIRTSDKAGMWDSTSSIQKATLNTFPDRDYGIPSERRRIQALKGKKIIIYLPYYLKNVYYSKTFEFIIADIQAKYTPEISGPAS